MTIHVTPIPRLTTLVAPAFTLGTTNAAGAAITAVSSNSTILTYDTTVPEAVAGASATGSATTATRRDHVHSSQDTKVWINFNGTGTVAIRDSYNVASLTDQGTGEYQIVIDNDFANADYSYTIGSIDGVVSNARSSSKGAGTPAVGTFNVMHTTEGVFDGISAPSDATYMFALATGDV